MCPSKESYDPHYFEPLFAAEERHFWFVARNKVIRALARKALAGIDAPTILEVGCGTGNVLQTLEKEFPTAHLTGMDLFSEGLRFAHQRTHCGLVQADLAVPPLKIKFDLIGMFDVLEHIKEDQANIRQIYHLVKPGGLFMVTVPADPRLWSYFDLASHHVRRYTLESLRDTILQAGFVEEFLSPYIAITYPAIWLGRKVVDTTITSQDMQVQELAEKEFRIIPVINEIVCAILSLEAAWLSEGQKLPFGSSLVMMARKPVTSG